MSFIFEPAAVDAYGKIFNTFWFVGFAAIAIPIFWLLRKPALRLPFLAIACVVYHYHFAGPAGMLPIIELGIATYLIGLTRNRLACAIGIALSVLALCFYKYTHFLTAEVLAHFNHAWGTAAEKYATSGVFSPGSLEKSKLFRALATVFPPLNGLPAAPPLAVSFFAFEFVHYLFEVRRGAVPIRNPLKFVLFSIFFPSLVAGPIKRFGQFIPALEAGARDVGTADVAAGLQRIAMGYLKKVVVADNLTMAIGWYGSIPQFTALGLVERWFVFLLIAIRILFDFSGYSDIAIGLARLMGVQLPENFNWPYAATSIQEFWQRWHISLSSWIRDYVYIPLGGNRHGIARKIFNGLLAFALVGLWHGASWHFVIWGLYHGVGLAVCSNYAAVPWVGPVLHGFLGKSPRLCWLATQLFAWFGWLIFFYPVDQAIDMTRLLFNS